MPAEIMGLKVEITNPPEQWKHVAWTASGNDIYIIYTGDLYNPDATPKTFTIDVKFTGTDGYKIKKVESNKFDPPKPTHTEKGVTITPTGATSLDYTIVDSKENPMSGTVYFLTVDLDVDGNGSLNDACDGIATYLPRYSSDEPSIHEGETFAESSYTEPQSMRLYIVDAPQGLAAEAKIIQVTDYPSYTTNGIAPSIPKGSADFSLTAQGALEDVVQGQHDDTGLWFPIHCKDYGAWCKVAITLKKGSQSASPPVETNVPHDINEDKIADHWQYSEIDRWNAQYHGTEVITKDINGLNKWAIDSDAELKDSDGSGPMPAMADEGDGLTVLKEYRGYILDDGVAMNGKSHKRLSLARKELLVEVREEANMTAGQGPDTNSAALATFDATTALRATRDFYLDQQKGAEIDLYWVELELKIPNEPFPAVIVNGVAIAEARDNAHRWTGSVSMGSSTNPNAYTGAGLVYRDQQLLESQPETHALLYGSGEKSDPKLYQLNRHNDLGDFVKLYLPSRLGWVRRHTQLGYPDGILFTSSHATNTKNNRGVSIEVASIADERIYEYEQEDHFTTPQLTQLLDYLVAHEVGHLITPDLEGAGGHEDPGHGKLMGDEVIPVDNGTPVDLNQLEWGRGESIEGVNFKKRWSVNP